MSGMIQVNNGEKFPIPFFSIALIFTAYLLKTFPNFPSLITSCLDTMHYTGFTMSLCSIIFSYNVFTELISN